MTVEVIEKEGKRRMERQDNVPGKAIKASACRAISALRWCMSDTALTSPTVSPVI
jgi:hypothetical protein